MSFLIYNPQTKEYLSNLFSRDWIRTKMHYFYSTKKENALKFGSKKDAQQVLERIGIKELEVIENVLH